MKVVRYWAKETQATEHGGEVGCWGWSEDSDAEARQRSLSAGKRLAAWLDATDAQFDALPAPPNWYDYDAAPRERRLSKSFTTTWAKRPPW